MKKKLLILLSIMLLVFTAVFAVITINNNKELKTDEDNIRIVTSFYPVYILTLNLTDQVSGIKVDSLTDFSAGCLHDYQLTTNDMRLLSDADVFIINGGGMEEYLESVVKNYPDLTVIDLSKNISMLESLEHEGEYNPHVWLDPDLYMIQIENARQGLEEYFSNIAVKNQSEITEKINTNAKAYLDEVKVISDEMNRLLDIIKDMAENKNISNKVIIFHDSFAYLAKKAGLDVAFALEVHDDNPLSAGTIAEVIDLIKKDGIRYLFAEEQHKDTVSDRIKEETNAQVYIIDTAVTGDADKDSYVKSMRKNIETLKEAFESGN